MLIWLALLQVFLGGEFLSPCLQPPSTVASEIFVSDLLMPILSPVLALEHEPPEEESKNLELDSSIGLVILGILGICTGVWWFNRYRDVPTGQFAVEVKMMEDRRIRMTDGLLVGLHIFALVTIEDNHDSKEKAQNCLANSEGQITQEIIAAVVTSHVEAVIATEASNKSLKDILNDAKELIEDGNGQTNGVKNKIEVLLKTLGLKLVHLGIKIEGQNPYGKEYAVPVDLEGVQTQDNLQADLKTVFFVRIPDNGSGQPMSSVLVKNGEVSQKQIETAVFQRATPAIRAAASEVKLKEIDYSQFSSDESGSSGSFATKVEKKLRLSGTGLELVGIVISDIDGADIYETEYAVEVELAGPNALRMKDFLRADIQVTFLVKLSADNAQDIEKAYSALSEGEAISRERIRDAVRQRAISALQIQGFKKTLDELHSDRDQFEKDVKTEVEDKLKLKDIGLMLRGVIITEIEESDYYLDNANDYFDIQGIANRTQLIGKKQVEKREQELKTELELEKEELKNQKESLKTIQEQEQLAIDQEIALEQYRLGKQTELKEKQAEEQIKVETAEINAMVAIALEEIRRLNQEAERVRAEEGVNTAIEEARKERGETLVEIARQEAKRRKLLAEVDAYSKKNVSDLNQLAMIVTTLMPQVMEHLPEITEIAKAMSLQPGALSNAHLYNMSDSNGQGWNKMLLLGGLGNFLTLLMEKLDLDPPPNSSAISEANDHQISPSTEDLDSDRDNSETD